MTKFLDANIDDILLTANSMKIVDSTLVFADEEATKHYTIDNSHMKKVTCLPSRDFIINNVAYDKMTNPKLVVNCIDNNTYDFTGEILTDNKLHELFSNDDFTRVYYDIDEKIPLGTKDENNAKVTEKVNSVIIKLKEKYNVVSDDIKILSDSRIIDNEYKISLHFILDIYRMKSKYNIPLGISGEDRQTYKVNQKMRVIFQSKFDGNTELLPMYKNARTEEYYTLNRKDFIRYFAEDSIEEYRKYFISGCHEYLQTIINVGEFLESNLYPEEKKKDVNIIADYKHYFACPIADVRLMLNNMVKYRNDRIIGNSAYHIIADVVYNMFPDEAYKILMDFFRGYYVNFNEQKNRKYLMDYSASYRYQIYDLYNIMLKFSNYDGYLQDTILDCSAGFSQIIADLSTGFKKQSALFIYSKLHLHKNLIKTSDGTFYYYDFEIKQIMDLKKIVNGKISIRDINGKIRRPPIYNYIMDNIRTILDVEYVFDSSNTRDLKVKRNNTEYIMANLFKGYPISFEDLKNTKNIRDDLKKLIDFLRSNIFQTEHKFKWFILWLKYIITTKKKTHISLNLFSKVKGVGKSLVIMLVRMLLSYYTKDITEKSLSGDFQDFHDERNRVIFLDETNNIINENIQVSLRKFITADSIEINKKNRSSRNIMNNSNLLSASNNIFIDLENTRRFYYINIVDFKYHPKNKEYWKSITKIIQNTDVVRKFYDYIINFKSGDSTAIYNYLHSSDGDLADIKNMTIDITRDFFRGISEDDNDDDDIINARESLIHGTKIRALYNKFRAYVIGNGHDVRKYTTKNLKNVILQYCKFEYRDGNKYKQYYIDVVEENNDNDNIQIINNMEILINVTDDMEE